MFLAITAVTASAAHAQDGDPGAPAHVAVVDGDATIEREGDAFSASPGEPLVSGDRVRTHVGRLDIWFGDGSMVALDEHTTVDLPSSTLLRLSAGRVFLTVAGTPQDNRNPDGLTIDTPLGSVFVSSPGEYTLGLLSGPDGESLELAVLRGLADLTTDGGSMRVTSGEHTSARDQGPPSYPQHFNAAQQDDFERWVSLHRDSRRGRTTSNQYLPPNLRMYGGTFDRHGSWEYEAAYGYVWYPVVPTGWRPYFHGYWRPLPSYGWTWVGTDRWGWPTHHYGRWGFGKSRWFWIPERRWAPAWVSWASAPDYVSWCPLGVDNRPVLGAPLRSGSGWAGWVVLPRQTFGRRDLYVARDAYDPKRLPRGTAFSVQTQSPVPLPAFRANGSAGGRALNRLPVSPRSNGRQQPLGAATDRDGTRETTRRDTPGSPMTQGRLHGPGGQTDVRANRQPDKAPDSVRRRGGREATPDPVQSVPWPGSGSRDTGRVRPRTEARDGGDTGWPDGSRDRSSSRRRAGPERPTPTTREPTPSPQAPGGPNASDAPASGRAVPRTTPDRPGTSRGGRRGSDARSPWNGGSPVDGSGVGSDRPADRGGRATPRATPRGGPASEPGPRGGAAPRADGGSAPRSADAPSGGGRRGRR
ncbi:MAG: DUF6600 domain-containing protein [Vicinamibacterales bacterium]